MNKSTAVFFIVLFASAWLSAIYVIAQTPKVELPEEYKEITRDTPIQGHFEGDKLIIEFKHN